MKLSILIAHYDETGEYQPYLDLCLKSLQKQTFQDFENIVVASGNFVPSFEPYSYNNFHYSKNRMHFPKAIEKAYSMCGDSEFVMLLNNDTVLDTQFLATMIDLLERYPEEIILNGLCNADAFGFFYWALTGIKGKQPFTKPQYKIEEFENPEELMDLITYPFAVVAMPFSCFYGTMMKRSTYDKVGGIDKKFQTNKDDLDFCIRARKFGIKSMVAMHAAIFHFGGVTTNKTKTPEEEKFNIEYFNSKHGDIL